ncbi:MAG: GAF domain-containing protein [Candidatus Obscuribacterales bacterium]|nr:GAF domain-containing protein [Candidatus Obscuribacterales bacterium]
MNGASVELDLDRCATEKIHIPGSVQPHGVLLCLNVRDLKIVQASESSASVFGRPTSELIGASLESIVGKDTEAAIKRHFSGENLQPSRPLNVLVNTGDSPDAFDLVAHQSDGCLVLEFERSVPLDVAEALKFLQAKDTALHKVLACTTAQELLDFVAEYVRSITGFDRVMIYLFDREWNGIVQAERKLEGEVGYLGLRFPASDIPPQARDLYARNCLRLLVDVDAVPAPIEPTLNPLTGEPLDLSYSILRSMSPLHIEYLKNMNVRASMSVSLVANGELRGLIACHHSSARHVNYGIRDTCEFLARLVSLQLNILQQRDHSRMMMSLQDARRDLILHASGEKDFISAIAGSGKLLKVARAQGAAIVWDEQVFVVGETPDQQSIAKVAHELTRTVTGPLFATECLSNSMPWTKELMSCASGLLSIRMSAVGSRWILWFRPEQVAEVKWAGNPEKPVDIDNHKRLHPALPQNKSHPDRGRCLN